VQSVQLTPRRWQDWSALVYTLKNSPIAQLSFVATLVNDVLWPIAEVHTHTHSDRKDAIAMYLVLRLARKIPTDGKRPNRAD
jgi:hypothetical protein